MFVTQQPQQRVMVQQASRGGNSRAAPPQQVMMANSSKNIVQVQQQPIQQPVSQVKIQSTPHLFAIEIPFGSLSLDCFIASLYYRSF